MTTTLIIAGVVVLLLFYFISVYNGLSKKRIVTKESWSGIGAFLQQRLDMIPALVEVVKGYAGHENKTLTDVIRARNESITALTPEAQMEAAKNMSAAMFNFKSLTEQYPDLKANVNFTQLQAQLAEMEEKINQSRRYYNGTVREYNQALAVFPQNIIGGMFGFKEATFFAEDEAAKTASKISFS